ncbi:MAG TPA: glycosyltransferase [Bacteroidota bacterium]|nr:glycosyltransferase [Bacteroidota bacterium]
MTTGPPSDIPRPDKPRVSVIVPAFQEESRLGRILSQFPPAFRRRRNVQLIVSDGGSTDRTCEIASGAADVLVENTDGHRQTISEGRNRGADAAGGELLVFLNADVTVDDPDNLLTAARVAFRDRRIVAAICRVLVDPAEETLFDRCFHVGFTWWCRLVTLLGAGMGRGECQIVRAELFRMVGGYNERLAAAEDYDLFRRVGKRGRIAFLRGVTIYESPRRYRALGYPKVLAMWFLNALSVMVKGSSRSKRWDAVR